jgi:hypothetical protein
MRIIEFSQRVKLTSRGDEIIISRLLGSFNIAVVLGVASEMRTRRIEDRGPACLFGFCRAVE